MCSLAEIILNVYCISDVALCISSKTLSKVSNSIREEFEKHCTLDHKTHRFTAISNQKSDQTHHHARFAPRLADPGRPGPTDCDEANDIAPAEAKVDERVADGGRGAAGEAAGTDLAAALGPEPPALGPTAALTLALDRSL